MWRKAYKNNSMHNAVVLVCFHWMKKEYLIFKASQVSDTTWQQEQNKSSSLLVHSSLLLLFARSLMWWDSRTCWSIRVWTESCRSKRSHPEVGVPSRGRTGLAESSQRIQTWEMVVGPSYKLPGAGLLVPEDGEETSSDPCSSFQCPHQKTFLGDELGCTEASQRSVNEVNTGKDFCMHKSSRKCKLTKVIQCWLGKILKMILPVHAQLLLGEVWVGITFLGGILATSTKSLKDVPTFDPIILRIYFKEPSRAFLCKDVHCHVS